ncbi:hypothetical protein BGX27_007930 [Mortierella sp. AM989]|nr:hypothetical protein BGX27_007930 [Mortierella sp. AM989]
MAVKKSISYTQLPSSEYTQRTLGVNNGIVIETDQVKLVPILLERDTPLLWEMYKNHPELFKWMPCGPLYTYDEFHALQAGYCASPEYFNWICYVRAEGGKEWVLCGSISLLDISLIHRRCEIGGIWFHPSVHGTFVMLEVTYALVRFSFERLQSGRVQWKTHHKNIASQKAATKLGFDLDGVHRKHIIHSDGAWRDTYFYSIIDDDWFGREATTDGRPKLDVEEAAKATEQELLLSDSQGRQKRLEELIVNRKQEGKPLPSGVARGEAFN